MNCTTLDLDDGIPMAIEPILLDANGDHIADLFGVDENQAKGKFNWSFYSKINDSLHERSR